MNVSFITANYNYADYIVETLESALAQDYTGGRIECVVVDDGSTDASVERLRAMGDRIVLHCQENAGQSAAMSAAFERATGDIIMLLDSDDLCDPGKVTRVVEAFREFPSVGMVHHKLRLVGSGGEPVDWEGRPVRDLMCTTNRGSGDLRSLMRRRVLPWKFSPTSGLCLRREVAQRVFPLQTHLMIDVDALVAPPAALLAPVHYIEEVLGAYRIHGVNAHFVAERNHVLERARSKAELIEQKVVQGENALQRSGGRGILSPWWSWDYLRAKAMIEGCAPKTLLSRALGEIFSRSNCLRPWEKVAAALYLTRKALRFKPVQGRV